MKPEITIGTEKNGYHVLAIVNDDLGPGVLIQHKQQAPVRLKLKEAQNFFS